MILSAVVAVLLAQAPAEAAAQTRPKRVFLAEDDLATYEPRRFRYRGTSFGFGVRTVARPAYCRSLREGCTLSPLLAATSEFGSTHARLVVELFSAPVDYWEIDFGFPPPAIALAVGGLFGNEKVRGGLLATGGYYWWGVDARLMITPWRTARGGRHGLELAVGWGLQDFLSAAISYRWFPARLNHRRR